MGLLPQVQLEDNALRSANMEQPILQVSHLSVTFARHRGTFGEQTAIRAINDVSFEIFESESLCLVGESGSGKSTIARCISLLTRPTGGSIIFDGSDVTKFKGKDLLKYRRNVQMVFQDPFESLNPRHNVLTTISTPLKLLTGEKKASVLFDKVSNLLEEVGLEAGRVIRRYPHQLSGGERQRVNIARALASEPKLLIADEPITMLDAEQRLNILSLLLKLKTERNLTLLMITHDLASARITSDRTLVLYLGNLVESGETKSVLSRPHHPYVELIMNAIPRIHLSSEISADAETTSPTIEESSVVTKGCVFLPRCKYGTSTCKEVEPKLEEKSPDHQAACHNPLNTSTPETRAARE